MTFGRGQKVKYDISYTASISKIFIPNFVFSQTKYIKHITYRPDFSLCDPGHAAEVGLGMGGGGGRKLERGALCLCPIDCAI